MVRSRATPLVILWRRRLGIGPLVRRAFGRHERRVAEIYRGFFVDLGEFVASIRDHVQLPTSILEIGCGDGMVTERLVDTFPGATVTGIDICAQPGRLYRGDRSRIRFLRMTTNELAATEQARYQLVIITDVLHHVPHRGWPDFLSAAHRLTADGGKMVIKDWVRQRTAAYLLGYLSDRYVTGDRIRYPQESELRTLARNTFGARSVESEFRVKPWNCNLALVIAPSPPERNMNADAQSESP